MAELNRIAIIGAPTSAGAYSPGQEKTPDALRRAGLVERLAGYGFDCVDCGDVEGFRWQADRNRPRAMNVQQVARIASDVAEKVAASLGDDRLALVLGGDCTVELGTLAGTLRARGNVGLIYYDLDVDMNTPETTTDGALDWMGVAHMLATRGSLHELTSIGPRQPMMGPQDLLLFGCSNIKPSEAALIDSLQIATVPASTILEDRHAAGDRALSWARSFDNVLVHFDADAIDFEDFPLAENTRRKSGLSFETAMAALETLLSAPNLAALTVCEINPDHGAADGSTLSHFVERLASALRARLGEHRSAQVPSRAPTLNASRG